MEAVEKQENEIQDGPIIGPSISPLAFLKREMQAAQEDLSGIEELVKIKQAALKETMDRLYTEFQQANAELFANYETVRETARVTENALREAIVAEYERRGDQVRQIDAELGLSVQVRKTYTIKNRERMIAWASGRPEFLAPNEKSILEVAKNEALVKAFGIDFVEVVEKPTAVIKAE